VARDRQRAKQRQAERRARRQQQQRAGGRPPVEDGRSGGQPPVEEARAAEPDAPPAVPGIDDPRAANPAPGVFPDVAVGAPPADVGRTDRAFRDEPELEDERYEEELEAEALEEIDERELGDDGAAEDYAPRGRRGEAEAARARDRPRVIQFLIASWAELQRVQWPDRQALTTLTGVVLGFVLIMGGYLGLLDAIFSRVIQAIL
jgi:preprotein translocase SecE subunit